MIKPKSYLLFDVIYRAWRSLKFSSECAQLTTEEKTGKICSTNQISYFTFHNYRTDILTSLLIFSVQAAFISIVHVKSKIRFFALYTIMSYFWWTAVENFIYSIIWYLGLKVLAKQQDLLDLVKSCPIIAILSRGFHNNSSIRVPKILGSATGRRWWYM